MKKMAAILLVLTSSIGVLVQAPSAAFAAAHYRAVIMADYPMMYWRLGESYPGSAYDETSNHRDATYVHDPFVSLVGAIRGDTNTAAGFNGVDQYVEWDPFIAYYYPYTVEAWVRLRSVTDVATIFSTRSATGDYAFDLKLETLGGKRLHVDIGNGQSWLANPDFDFDFQPHTWYYVAVTVTTTEAIAYVNGAALGSATYSGYPYLFAGPVQIATDTRYDDEWFHGKIDEVAVYRKALRPDQVLAHYQAGL